MDAVADRSGRAAGGGVCAGRPADVAVAVDDRAGAARLGAAPARAPMERRPTEPPAWQRLPRRGGGRAADVAVAVEDRAGAARLGAGSRSSSWRARAWRGRPGRRRAGRRPGPGRRVVRRGPPSRGAAARPGRPSAAAVEPAGGGLGGVRLQAAAQLVALGQRRGVGLLGHRQRAADGVQPDQVGVHRRRLGGHGSERRDVGYGEARGRARPRRRSGRRGHAAPRRGPRARRAGRCARASSWASARRFDAPTMRSRSARRGVVLQRAEQPADVGAPLGPGQSRRRPARRACPASALGGLVRRAGSRSTRSRTRSTEARSGRRRAGGRPPTGRRPAARAASGQRVGEPAGLGQRDGQRAAGAVRQPARRPRAVGVEPAPDQRGEALQLGRPDPAGVPGGHEQVVAVGDGLPERHREQHVAGERRPGPRRRGRPRRAGRARRLRCVAPGAEGLEVAQRVRRRPAPGRAGPGAVGAVVAAGRRDHGVRP